jgi:hypothetical protein
MLTRPILTLNSSSNYPACRHLKCRKTLSGIDTTTKKILRIKTFSFYHLTRSDTRTKTSNFYHFIRSHTRTKHSNFISFFSRIIAAYTDYVMARELNIYTELNQCASLQRHCLMTPQFKINNQRASLQRRCLMTPRLKVNNQRASLQSHCLMTSLMACEFTETPPDDPTHDVQVYRGTS